MSQVVKRVVPISQPQGSQRCWAAVVGMILGRSGPNIVNDIIAEAQNAGVPILGNGGMQPSNVPALARAFHLNQVSSSGVIAGQDVVDHMSLGCVGLLGQEAAGKHAVICHGMIGDFSSASSCDIWGVDPRGFTAINMSFFDFQTQFDIQFILFR